MSSKIVAPMAVKHELKRIGDRIRAVRLARRMPMQVLAEHAMTGRQTIGRIEAGDPRVAFGTVLLVLNALDLLGTMEGVANPGTDPMKDMRPADLRSRRARPRARDDQRSGRSGGATSKD
jgi:transcriptional regulator with XRE-family HTH domain